MLCASPPMSPVSAAQFMRDIKRGDDDVQKPNGHVNTIRNEFMKILFDVTAMAINITGTDRNLTVREP